MPNQGGTHEQHVKTGQQSHKNDDNRQLQAEGGNNRQQGDDNMDRSRGGTHEQHVKAGQQSHKNK